MWGDTERLVLFPGVGERDREEFLVEEINFLDDENLLVLRKHCEENSALNIVMEKTSTYAADLSARSGGSVGGEWEDFGLPLGPIV